MPALPARTSQLVRGEYNVAQKLKKQAIEILLFFFDFLAILYLYLNDEKVNNIHNFNRMISYIKNLKNFDGYKTPM